MPRPKSTISAVTPKIILVLAFLCLMITAIFGLLGSYRVDALRADVANANAARDASEHRRMTQEAKRTPAEAPEVGASAATISFSSAKALATFAPLPKYPLRVRSDGVTGSGVCVVSVDQASGRVTGASMEQSTGDLTLDKSAVRAFRKWRFKPGTVSKVRIPIEFTMTGASH